MKYLYFLEIVRRVHYTTAIRSSLLVLSLIASPKEHYHYYISVFEGKGTARDQRHYIPVSSLGHS